MKNIIRYIIAIISLAFTSPLFGWNVCLNDAEPDYCVYSNDQFTVAIEAGNADCQILITDNDSGVTVAGAFFLYQEIGGYLYIPLSHPSPTVKTSGGALPGGGMEVTFTGLPEGRNYTMSIFCPDLDREYQQGGGLLDFGTCTFETYSPAYADKFCRVSSWIGEPLYNRLDLRRYFPLPRDQGVQESCVAWAVSVARTYQLAQKRGITNVSDPSVQLSPAYIYNQIRPNGGSMSVEDALNLVRNQGCDTLNGMPYNVTADPDKDHPMNQPTDVQRQNAALNKVDGFYWYYLGDEKINNIKLALEAGNPVVITFNIRVPDKKAPVGWHWVKHGGNWYNPIPYYTYEPYIRYVDTGHAVCVVGYDDARRKLIYIDSLTIDYKAMGVDFTGWPVDGIPNDDTHAAYKERSYDDAISSATVMVQD